MRVNSKIRSFVSRWLLPPGVADLLRAAGESAADRAGDAGGVVSKKLLARNKKLHNRYSGRDCFILATGPSIARQDLKPLAGQLCMGVNQFYLHDDIKTINPQLHIVAPTHEPFDFEMTDKVLSGAKNNLPDSCDVFLGCTDYEYSFERAVRRSSDFTDEDFYYLDYTGYPALDSYNYTDEKLWDICSRPFAPRTVIYCAIQLAAYAGCANIYLLGCDHDYLRDFNRVTDHHFYAEASGISDAEHLSGFTTEKWFQEYHLRWMQYRLMGQALHQRGINIYNATDGGMLDVFERVDYEQLIEKLKK